MFRHEYHVPQEHEISPEEVDINSPSNCSSPRRNYSTINIFPRLPNRDEIRTRIYSKKNCLIATGLVILTIVCFSIMLAYGLGNRETHPLEDIYQDQLDKMTVVFPEQIREEKELHSTTTYDPPPPPTPPTTESLLLKHVLKNNPIQIKSEPATTSKPFLPAAAGATQASSKASAPSPVQSSLTASTISPPAAASEAGTSKICHGKPKRPLPDSAELYIKYSAKTLLHHMNVPHHYNETKCNQQIFGSEVTLSECGKKFGPFYAIGKKHSKTLAANKAVEFLYNMTYPPDPRTQYPKIDIINCHPVKD